jgi:hypothetical protein
VFRTGGSGGGNEELQRGLVLLQGPDQRYRSLDLAD